MEIVASVSAVVPVTVLLADKVLKYIGERGNKHGSKEIVEQLKAWLSKFQSFIKDQESNSQEYQSHLAKDFIKKIAIVTGDIEDALDEFMFAVPVHEHRNMLMDWRHVRKLSKCRDKIEAAIESEQLQHQLHMESTRAGGSARGSLGRCVDPLTHEFLVEDGIVGFVKRKDVLAEQLVGGDTKRKTIEVIGPGGSGKTFLVKNVCANVLSDFDCYAWINVSRSFEADVDKEDLFKQICSDQDRRNLDREAGNTEQKLRSYLEDKRYLIVLDNVWNKQAYTPIVNLLPNNDKGSRIILTSRKSHVVDNPDYTHKLDGLIEKESWDLFCIRAFHGRHLKACPQELIEVSKKILKRCDGLPLAIAAVGSLLSKRQLVEREWDNFLQSLGSELGSNSNLPIVSRILQPSFMDLPDHLRSCFLYFSIFPEDQAVSRGRLIRSWMAEGFLQEIEAKSPEEVAESYLNELIGQSLVRASAVESDGRVRSCQILRLHHEFIVPLLKEGNFVTVIDENSPPRSPDAKARRLSVQCKDFPKKLSQISDNLSHVRTLFVFSDLEVLEKNSSFRSAYKNKFKKKGDGGPGKPDASEESSSIRSAIKNKFKGKEDDNLEKVCSKFKLLKVLDFQGVPLHKLPEDVGSFVLLKCLNLRNTKVETIPDSVQKLTLLETLDLKYTLVRELPKWIIKLRNLRHLLVSWRNGPSNTAQGARLSKKGIGNLISLQTLSLIQVNNNHQILLQDLANLVQIKKLALEDLDEDCGKELCKSVEKMETLSKFDVTAVEGKYLELDHMERPPKHIQCLRLKGRLRTLPSWIYSLSSLGKVVLKGSKLRAKTQNPFFGLEDLPSLMELEMVDFHSGEAMEFKEGTFKNLRKLHVEQFENLIKAVVENEALAKLKSLTICKCRRLEPLPRSYPLGRLEELVVYDMSVAFILEIRSRIREGELVDHINEVEDTTTPSRIQSYRRVS